MNKTIRLYLRIAATIVLILGLLLVGARLGWYNLTEGGSGYNVLRWFHILVALGLVGLYEATMARSRTIMTPGGRQIGMVGRIVISLTLLYGIFLLLTLAFGWFTGDAYDNLVWVHVGLGLAAIALTEIVFSRRRLAANRL